MTRLKRHGNKGLTLIISHKHFKQRLWFIHFTFYYKMMRLYSYSILYGKDPKFSDRQVWANSVDPDQTAPRGAV